jgi:hypothetical protein
MTRYRVHVNYLVSQTIEVEADDVEPAKEKALERVEYPDATDRFEEVTDPEVAVVFDVDSGTHVWVLQGIPRGLSSTEEETA